MPARADYSNRTSMTGQRLGHYEIRGKLGEGGMGVVYRAYDERLHRDVALKLLPRGTLTDDSARKRFRKEGLSLSRLNHPNIATVHDFDTQDGVDFLVMELIPGETLSDTLRSGPLPEKQLLHIGLQFARGLAEAHEQGVIHRDLKPGNLRVTPDGRLKILDFGLATLRASVVEGSATASMTETGALAGTLPYMAPEQLRGEPASPRTDLYAAGAVLYEMATSRRPFAGLQGPELLGAILEKSPQPPAALNPQISPALESIILKAFDKDPARRYQSARELAIDLERLGTSATVHAAAPKPRWLVPAAATAALLALLAWLNPGGIRDRLLARPQARIGSLAVLPLKSLQQNAGDDYLGLGIADAIITRISQIDGIRVRPTSAIRKYSSQEVDSLKAAADLQVDAVLDGTVQRSGDRLRVTVNLLRIYDGASLWSETFNTSFSDIFTVQDQVSQQIASNLRLRLSPIQQARLTKRYTSNPEAYEYYLRGLRSITTFDRSELDSGLKMLQRAVDLDPNYALAHAQMAWAYTWLAVLVDAGPSWLEPARQSLQRASALDPELAESHVVRHLMLWSSYEGYQIAEAIRELKVAQRLNPSVGHSEMGTLYAHLGLLEPAMREIRRALELDPTSDLYMNELSGAYLFSGKYEEAVTSSQKLNWPNKVWAYLGARRLEEARRIIDPALAKNPDGPHNRANKALLLALEGKLAEAEAQIPSVPDSFRSNRSFHHLAFNVACVYGLAGKPGPAVDWLRAAVKEGMPNYPLFSGDPSFHRIRSDPRFQAFLAELKPVWEGYQREFQ